VEYRVLGKLEVVRDGQAVELGAFRQRALLALLLTAPSSVFSTDRILDELWGADGGIDKQNSLWVYVSGLRKALEPDREKRTDGTILLTRAPGYLIQAAAEQIDALRFERMVAEGRALIDVDAGAASVVLGEALALWRGLPYEDFTYEPFAQTEIARLEELRLEAVELRLDADLERGLARELISELESLARQHPLRERITGQLMLALYRSSRQADALRAYRLLKTRLAEELGIEPSAPIRKLEEQIVTADAALDTRSRVAVPASRTGPGPAVRGYELREQLGAGAVAVAYRAYQPAVGREVAIKVVRPDIANDPAFIRRFQAEAQLVATLEHPHIVPLYDYWREPNAAYLVTRLMRGGSLASVLERGALTPAQTLAMVDQLGNALQTAHRSGVVHGDINTGNILLDDDGNAYLSDFGIAVGDDDLPSGTDIHGLGVVVAEALTGRTGGVDELRQSLPDGVARVIDRATGVQDTGTYVDIDQLVADLQASLKAETGYDAAAPAPPVAGVANPYKGLRAFDTVDSDDFFGRERLVERLIARLGLSGTRGRFIAVVGPSGSGKSSAVNAGLLPAIRSGAVPLSGSWFTIEMTPAPHPFEQLEDALLGVAVDPPTSLLEQLAGEQGVQRALDRVLPDDGSQLLLVIDQFEELFTQVDTATANRFVANVVSAVTDEQSRIRVVVTLRADFYDRPLQQRGLGELLRDGTEIVTPMTTQELERAITRPAEQQGVRFEPALVAELVGEVTDRSGALPLLQYTLTELFESRTGNRIDFAAYTELNGVSGALVKRAEGLLTSLGSGADEVARQVFLRLVTFTEGGEDTRRRVLQSELEDLDVDRQLLRSVLDTFGRHRLLSFDRDPITRSPTVEISHEALLTEWARLRDWIDGARNDVRMQRRLAEAMREWVAAERADDYLMRGGLLDQVAGWSATTSLELSGPERAFLGASISERDREAQEVLQREQRAVVAERRQRQRGRQLLIVGLVAVLVAALAVFGTVQWRSAVDSKSDVEALLTVDDLVAASEQALDDDPQLALLLAMESVRETVDLGFASERAVDAVHFALHELSAQYDVEPGTPVALRSGPRGVVGVYALPPSELMELAEASADRTLTDAECGAFLAGPCPVEVEIPVDLEIRGGFDSYGAGDGAALAGTTVRISAPDLGEDPGFLHELDAFTDRTGIAVQLTPVDVAAAVNPWAGEPSHRPDVVAFNGWIPDWAEPRALDVARFVDRETLRSDFGEYLLGFGSSETAFGGPGDGSVRAVPVNLQPKGLVVYPKVAFEEAGYAPPSSWDELLALSDRIVADGGTPWCIGFQSGDGTGWPGTDWLESLVLRVGGVDVYDAWTRGEIGFTSPAVMEAGRLAGSVIFAPGYVRGGPGSISRQFFSPPSEMLARDDITGESAPECWLDHQPSFSLSPGWAPEGAEIGTNLDFFVLPPLDRSEPTPMTGGAGLISALVDRPEVRAFMEFVASPEWGEVWVRDTDIGFTSANRRFDASAYGDASDPAVAVQVRLSELAHSALQSDAFRFDASDAMPNEIGGMTDAFSPGAFWQGMLDWVDGTRSFEQVFADIDAEWAALRANSASPPPDG
jgi:DNA-binding SARP family transcriptional activator/ABC-type glycerol-3-phosphate transport system substrate-binding protein/tRNA A-37 threonylcarbamoyl transferase component Bud32/energy-coupling factor transporter ATP-binding protein EcfA2